MGFLEILTLILVVLKLTNVIAWGWLAVFSPLLISLSIYLLCFIGWFILMVRK